MIQNLDQKKEFERKKSYANISFTLFVWPVDTKSVKLNFDFVKFISAFYL